MLNQHGVPKKRFAAPMLKPSVLPVVPKPVKVQKVKAMTEAQLKGIVSTVIEPQIKTLTSNFMEELTASKNKLEQRYVDTAFEKMAEQREKDAWLTKHVTGQVVGALREEFET